jgi:hypothetical protein
MAAMKLFLYNALIVFLLSCQNKKQDTEVKIASASQETGDSSISLTPDSSVSEERSNYDLWLTQTFYSLRTQGLSPKKTWLYIDSLTKSMYKGIVPRWYQGLKQDFDSTVRQKNIHKRKPII